MNLLRYSHKNHSPGALVFEVKVRYNTPKDPVAHLDVILMTVTYYFHIKYYKQRNSRRNQQSNQQQQRKRNICQINLHFNAERCGTGAKVKIDIESYYLVAVQLYRLDICCVQYIHWVSIMYTVLLCPRQVDITCKCPLKENYSNNII